MTAVSWRARLLAVLAGSLALAALLGSPGETAARPATTVAGPKLVLAFYYTWYGPTSWDQGQMSDRPAAPYISDHDDVIARQISEAQGAGISGFITSWMGANTESARNLNQVLGLAAARNFKISMYIETDSVMRNGDLAQQLRYAIATYSTQPAFLRWNGKPVIFFWRPDAYGSPAAWVSLRRQLDPNNSLIWSADTTNSAYLDAFDTIHFFSGGKWQGNTDVGAVDRQWRGIVDKYNHDHGTQRLWTAGVIPGWDESRVQPPRPNAKVFPRQNGSMYETNWQAALSSSPEWVTITSWNEWFEGTQIEPSTSYGNRYLDLTRKWATQFTGTAPPVCEAMNGHQVCGPFLDYWKSHGGLAQQGYPIGDQISEPSLTDPGKTYVVQYFERAIFEQHPENAPPYDVLLTQLGRARYACKYPQGAPGQKPNPDNPRVFPETGHTVGGAFREYWESHGGLAQVGYPISDEFQEASDLDPGKTYIVQYFERAVLEFHPDNPAPFNVLLAQLGTYAQRKQLCPGRAAADQQPAVQIPAPPSRPANFQPQNVRFFTSASQGCGAKPQTTFRVGQMIYAQLAMTEAPAGTEVAVTWSGGANGYKHTDTQVAAKDYIPVCFDGFSLEPSRYGIGPGHYVVTATIDGTTYGNVEIDISK